MILNQKFKSFAIPVNIEQSNKIKSYNLANSDRKYFNFTIGQSPFPLPKHISDSLVKHANRNEYSPPLGPYDLNDIISKFYEYYHNVYADSKFIFSGLGTKNILFLLSGMIEGTYFLPVPAWGGYEPFLQYYNRNIVKINLNPDNHFKFDMDELDRMFSENIGQKIFIFNSPHNPSGKVFSFDEMEQLVKLFKKHQIIVFSDEIYALTTYEINNYQSLYNLYPEKTFLLGGISKDRSAAGYRFGVCILPTENQQELLSMIKKAISNLYVSLPTPIQLAARDAYSICHELDEYLLKTRKTYKAISDLIINELKKVPKVRFYKPQAGFYITIDLNEFKNDFKRNNILDVNKLLYDLFDDPYNIALVPGTTMGLALSDFTFRIAFVDFDGTKMLARKTFNSRNDFKHMITGINKLLKFLKRIEERDD